MDTQDGGVNDDELNQMIAGLQSAKATPPVVTSNTGAPVVPAVQPTPSGDGTEPAIDATDDVAQPAAAPAPAASVSEPVVPPVKEQSAPDPVVPTPVAPVSELENIKKDALTELRPLVDKLNLPPEDKFDTLLLMIRSTDDSSLVPVAHAAAKQITDDTRRAQALLDIIKEIDFFGQSNIE